jgi:hypothetical protein
MSAVLTRRRRMSHERDPVAYRQASLFGQVVAPPPLEVGAPAEPIAQPEEEIRVTHAAPAELPEVASGTLDAAISALWNDLLAGESGTCPMCGDALEPQRSAGAGVHGGRCGTCSATLV